MYELFNASFMHTTQICGVPHVSTEVYRKMEFYI